MRQAEALAILQSGASVFLTGAPGAGKTYVLNEFVRQARAEGAAVSVTASTGIAATHINGDRKSTRLNSSHSDRSRMPSSA